MIIFDVFKALSIFTLESLQSVQYGKILFGV